MTKKALNLFLEESTIKQMKIAALEEECTVSDLITALFFQYATHGRISPNSVKEDKAKKSV